MEQLAPHLHLVMVMETILRFVFMDYLNKLKAVKYWGSESPRLVFQFELVPEQVMAVIHAAHFLGIEHLLSVAATMVAHNLKDVPDLSSLPPDLAWCIAEQFSAQDLFYAEERGDFVSLNLDTVKLWERHCKKLLEDDIVFPVSSSSTYPAYDSWDQYQGPPPKSWKSLYVSTYLQQLADRQNGGDNENFLVEVNQKAKHAYCHSVRRNFWEWVINGDASLFFTYISSFKNLFKLCLVKLPLGNPSKDGVLPCSKLGDLLESLPLLQYLDISEAGIQAEGAACLSIGLARHKGIQVLHLANNNIGTQGFAAIAMALPFARTLKVLDVRENGIGAWVPLTVVEALQEANISELLLEDNFRVTKKQALLHENRNVQVVQLSTTDMSLDILLISGLPKSLRYLQLTQCNLNDLRTKVLAQTLSSLQDIEILDLSDNKITSEGAIHIFLWMEENASLLELALSNNKITDSCAHTLSRAINRHTSIQKLSLKGNYSYGESHIQEVVSSAIERGLTLQATEKSMKFTLDLRSTDISHAMQARLQRQNSLHSCVNLLM